MKTQTLNSKRQKLKEKIISCHSSKQPIKVKDLMTAELHTIDPDDCIKKVEEMMKWKKVRHIPVVDKNLKLLGLITHRNLLDIKYPSFLNLPEEDLRKLKRTILVKKVMKSSILTADPEVEIQQIISEMVENKYGCIPVIKDEKIIGIVTEADFVLLSEALLEVVGNQAV